eukprot:CAMPEP_0169313872 /NCGR_PEP_ID=MMETSP1017-20121227/4805_1 /TAXON_ID=342587 /ORGANISM="Karlodinium micrum, Strain CCMP2283" /LENGTH=854 /DNA_ID=CAMNT_0009407751 /DNA_START=51 /DNA_END=2618 /DNA_ORIENTATION=+
MAGNGDRLRAALGEDHERRNSADSNGDDAFGFLANVPRAPAEEEPNDTRTHLDAEPERKASLIGDYTIGDGTITANVRRSRADPSDEGLVPSFGNDSVGEHSEEHALEEDNALSRTAAFGDTFGGQDLSKAVGGCDEVNQSSSETPSVTMADFEKAFMGDEDHADHPEEKESISASEAPSITMADLEIASIGDGENTSQDEVIEKQDEDEKIDVSAIVDNVVKAVPESEASFGDDGNSMLNAVLAQQTKGEDLSTIDAYADEDEASTLETYFINVGTAEIENAPNVEKLLVEDGSEEQRALEQDLMAVGQSMEDRPSLEGLVVFGDHADNEIWMEVATNASKQPLESVGRQASIDLVDASDNALTQVDLKVEDDGQSRNEAHKESNDSQDTSPETHQQVHQEPPRVESQAMDEECAIARQRQEESLILEERVHAQTLEIEELHEGLDLIQMQSKQLILQGLDFNEQLAEQTARCQDLQSQVHELNTQLRQREVELKRSRQQTRDVSEAEQLCTRRLEHRESMCEQAMAYSAYCEKAYSDLKSALPGELEHLEQHIQVREVRCEAFLEEAVSTAKKLSASCTGEIADLREELKTRQNEYAEESLACEDALHRVAEAQKGQDDVEDKHMKLQEAHNSLKQQSKYLEAENIVALQQNRLLKEHLSGSGEVVESLRVEVVQSRLAASKIALHGEEVAETLKARPSHDLVEQLQSELATCRSQISAHRASAEHRFGLLEARLALREAQLGLRSEYSSMDQSSLDSYRSHLSDRLRSPMRTPGTSLSFSSPRLAYPSDTNSRSAHFNAASPYALKQRQNFSDMYSEEYRPMFEPPFGQMSEPSRYGSPFSPGMERLIPNR